MTSITPTIGRVVWFWPGTGFRGAVAEGQPLDAHICCVHGDDHVNVAGFDAEGQHYVGLDVYLVPAGVEPPTRGEVQYATWMPYQVGQAAKDQGGQTPAPPPVQTGAPIEKAADASGDNGAGNAASSEQGAVRDVAQSTEPAGAAATT